MTVVDPRSHQFGKFYFLILIAKMAAPLKDDQRTFREPFVQARSHGVNESDPRLLLRQFTRYTSRESLNSPFAICLSAVAPVF